MAVLLTGKRDARETRTAGSSWYVGMLKVGADQGRIEERARGVLETAVFLVEMKDLADLID